MTFVYNFEAFKIAPNQPKNIIMHLCLIRQDRVHLRLYFQGAVYKDQTIFHKAVEALNSGSSLTRIVDIIAHPSSMLPAGLELKEKLVLLQAACQTLA